MMMRLVTAEECAAAISWSGAINALRRGHLMARSAQGDILLGSGNTLLLTRSAKINGMGFAIKGDSFFPGNTVSGRPSVQGAIVLFDECHGAVRAVIDSQVITQYKTAADSLLGASYLARPDSRQLLNHRCRSGCRLARSGIQCGISKHREYLDLVAAS